jgi:hypothetical protein
VVQGLALPHQRGGVPSLDGWNIRNILGKKPGEEKDDRDMKHHLENGISREVTSFYMQHTQKG